MDTLKTLADIWPVLAALGGFTLWLMSLEFRLRTIERDACYAEKKLDSLEQKIVIELGEIKDALARLEERSKHV